MALLVSGAWAAAQVEDARKAQVDAAVANAVDGLYRDVARSPVYGRTTVGDLVDKVGGRDDVMRTLQGAQEIGGPRWLDDQTAQVRLEINGSRVAQTILQLAASNPKRTPVRADALAPLLADWDRKTFGAVGTSTGAAAVVDVRPVREDPAWAGVPEAARKGAIAAARTNAVQRTVDAVRAVELKPGITVGQVMDRAGSPVRGAVEGYLQGRPVTSVQFRPDRQVEVVVSAPPEEVADVVRVSVVSMGDPQLADVEWGKVRAQVGARIGEGVGVAKVGDTQAAAQQQQQSVAASEAVRLPSQPPEWVWKQVDADGTARGGGTALKCARAAEGEAVKKIRTQVEGLPLAGGMTVGDAEKRDQRIADAVTRGVARARVYKTTYHPDGTVTAYVSLDLREMWEELQRP